MEFRSRLSLRPANACSFEHESKALSLTSQFDLKLDRQAPGQVPPEDAHGLFKSQAVKSHLDLKFCLAT